MTTETPTPAVKRAPRLNRRDLCGALAFLAQRVGRIESDPTDADYTLWRDLCAACDLSASEMAHAINAAAKVGRRSIARELRAQRGGS